MLSRKLEEKAAEKKDELRKKYRRQLEVLGESVEDVKERLSRLVSSDGDSWPDWKARVEKTLNDLKGRLKIRR